MLSEQDDGHVVIVRVGEEVRVALPENASTGFRWAIDHVDGDVIEVVAQDAVYPSAAVGSGGLAVFIFRGRKPGAGELRLKHWRHWEGDASVIRRFRLEFQVQP
ncbi:MAG TPA: protease inhibitor I42 family protein [Rhodocyclaceae bacterium]|nr:protease inhibitor I42 family protein [Rhodocyclaceae bacterium]